MVEEVEMLHNCALLLHKMVVSLESVSHKIDTLESNLELGEKLLDDWIGMIQNVPKGKNVTLKKKENERDNFIGEQGRQETQEHTFKKPKAKQTM